jgi:C1A family cysteine protease
LTFGKFIYYLASQNKSYKTREEFEVRLARWEMVDNYISEVNDFNSGFTHTAAHNQFSDWTQEEIDAMLPETDIGRKVDAVDPVINFDGSMTAENNSEESVNWVEKNCVNTPQKQGKCGACYAFAATSAVESSYCIASGVLLKLSEQQLIDCQGPEFKSNGCKGGSSFLAFDYLTQAGQELESTYPYASQKSGEQGTCSYSGS